MDETFSSNSTEFYSNEASDMYSDSPHQDERYSLHDTEIASNKHTPTEELHDSSPESTDFNYCLVDEKEEDSIGGTRRYSMNGKLGSDDADIVNAIRNEDESAEEDSNLNTDDGVSEACDSKTSNDLNLCLDDAEEMSGIVLQLKDSSEVKPKRRPRKSSEPKRIVQNFTDSILNDPDVDLVPSESENMEDSVVRHTSKDILIDSDAEDYGDQISDESSEFVSFEYTLSPVIPGVPIVSVPNQTQGSVEARKEPKRKKLHTPQPHGIELPEAVLVENGEKPFLMLPCQRCKKMCKSKASYIAHFKACSSSVPPNSSLPNGKYECNVCGKTYELRPSLQRHMRIHSGLDEFKCYICDKLFSDAKSLREHMFIHTGEKPHGIEIPEAVLVNPENGEKPVLMLPCERCKKLCKSKASYIAHFKACSSSVPPNSSLPNGKYECDICGKTYELRPSLQRHMRIHLGLDEFKCSICEKQFSDAKSLRGHIFIHTGEKPFSCRFCEFKFRDKSTLRKHETRHGTERPFKCDVCLKAFFLGVDLRKHQKVHLVDREFKCDRCDKQFYLVAQLRRHYRVHTGERPFECELCGKFFTDRTALKCHTATHTGTKPYQCDLCGATFPWRCRLDKHLKAHNNDRPYKCSLCPRAFIQNCDLRVHEKIHSGERNYHCLTCGKTFADSSCLWKHKKTHVKTKNHVCSFCGKAFVNMFVLKRHWTTCKPKRLMEIGMGAGNGELNNIVPIALHRAGEEMVSVTNTDNGPDGEFVRDTHGSERLIGKGDLSSSAETEVEILINEVPEIPLKSFLTDSNSATFNPFTLAD